MIGKTVSQKVRQRDCQRSGWRTDEIGNIQTGAPGADQPAEHGAATSPDSVRLSENAARRLHRTPARRNGETVKQLPPGPGGEDWYEWEERPGPEPASNASGPNDEILVHVCYVERTRI